MTRYYSYRNFLIALTLMTSLVEISCTKEIKPLIVGGKEEAAYNFYCASAVLNTLPAGSAPIYIDATQYNPANGFVPITDPFPYFSFGLSNARHQSPFLTNTYGTVMYLRHAAGPNRIIFTDTTRHKIADTIIDASAGSRNFLYLADEPLPDNSIARYSVLHVQDDAAGIEGKVKLRVINLSPDAGAIDVIARKTNGDWLRSPLPNELAFGGVSDHISLDTAGITGNGQIVLNILSATQEPLLSTGLPAVTGASYTLVIEGFKNSTSRLIPTRKKPDDNFEYGVVNVPANLKATIRRVY